MLISVKTLLKRGRYITIKNEKVILMLDETELVFISTTGRSGTKYLANIINKNAINATAEHDPYPRGYGEPIKWYDSGEKEKLIRFAKTKMKRLNRGKKFNGLLVINWHLRSFDEKEFSKRTNLYRYMLDRFKSDNAYVDTCKNVADSWNKNK
jgi:hypothetical protein